MKSSKICISRLALGAPFLVLFLLGCSKEPDDGVEGVGEKEENCLKLARELEETQMELDRLKEKIREEDDALQGLLR